MQDEARKQQHGMEEDRSAHSQALIELEAAKSRLEKDLRVKCEELAVRVPPAKLPLTESFDFRLSTHLVR